MKLVFPTNETNNVTLEASRLTIGSAEDCDVILSARGISPHHATFEKVEDDWQVSVDDPKKFVTVNGERVKEKAIIRAGDRLTFVSVLARIIDSEEPDIEQIPEAPIDNEEDEDDKTRIRTELPRFVLRGVSGDSFGRTYPLYSSILIGRHPDCDIVLDSDEISRRHAQLKVDGDEVSVHDLGSSNGTFINGEKVRNGLLKSGDELSLDKIRFILQTSGLSPGGATPETVEKKGTSSNGLLYAVISGVLAIAIAAALYSYFN